MILTIVQTEDRQNLQSNYVIIGSRQSLLKYLPYLAVNKDTDIVHRSWPPCSANGCKLEASGTSCLKGDVYLLRSCPWAALFLLMCRQPHLQWKCSKELVIKEVTDTSPLFLWTHFCGSLCWLTVRFSHVNFLFGKMVFRNNVNCKSTVYTRLPGTISIESHQKTYLWCMEAGKFH